MLPALRKKLKNVSSSNQSLQDILQSSKEADAVITITKVETGIHNTQLVLSIINQEPRICFYNRLDIKKIISSAFVSSGNVVNDIKTLNNQGYDFTEDDLDIVSGSLIAKETSLGYFGTLGEGWTENALCAIAKPYVKIAPDLYNGWTEDGSLPLLQWDIRIDGILYPFNETRAWVFRLIQRSMIGLLKITMVKPWS